MKKSAIFGIIGGVLLVASAVVGYIKRDEIKEKVGEIKDRLKKKNQETQAED